MRWAERPGIHITSPRRKENPMKEKLQAIREEALAQIEQAGALDKLNVSGSILGKKGN